MSDTVYFVYITINMINGKMYIGQHRCKYEEQFTDGYLGSGTIIRNAIKKYGKENFKRIILEYADNQEDLNALERKYVDESIICNENFYNLVIGGGAPLGMKHSDETRNKISEALKGRRLSEEHKKKLSIANTGKTRTEEQNRQHGEFMKLLYASEPGRIEKLRERMLGNMCHKGHAHTDESKRKMSESRRGKKAWNKGKQFSEESRKRMSEAHKGKQLSEKIREKMSEAQKRRGESKEYREMQSQMMKIIWAKRKGVDVSTKCEQLVLF